MREDRKLIIEQAWSPMKPIKKTIIIIISILKRKIRRDKKEKQKKP